MFEKIGVSNMMYVIWETVPEAKTALSELCSCIWLSDSSWRADLSTAWGQLLGFMTVWMQSVRYGDSQSVCNVRGAQKVHYKTESLNLITINNKWSCWSAGVTWSIRQISRMSHATALRTCCNGSIVDGSKLAGQSCNSPARKVLQIHYSNYLTV